MAAVSGKLLPRKIVDIPRHIANVTGDNESPPANPIDLPVMEPPAFSRQEGPTQPPAPARLFDFKLVGFFLALIGIFIALLVMLIISFISRTTGLFLASCSGLLDFLQLFTVFHVVGVICCAVSLCLVLLLSVFVQLK